MPYLTCLFFKAEFHRAMLAIPARRWRKAYSWGSLASQFSLPAKSMRDPASKGKIFTYMYTMWTCTHMNNNTNIHPTITTNKRERCHCTHINPWASIAHTHSCHSDVRRTVLLSCPSCQLSSFFLGPATFCYGWSSLSASLARPQVSLDLSHVTVSMSVRGFWRSHHGVNRHHPLEGLAVCVRVEFKGTWHPRFLSSQSWYMFSFVIS